MNYTKILIIFVMGLNILSNCYAQQIKPIADGKNFLRIPNKKIVPGLFPTPFIQQGNLRIVEYLLFHGGETEISNRIDATPLMVAAEKGSLDDAKQLIDHGADINAATDTGITAIMIASRKGNFEIVKFLLSKGAGINNQSYSLPTKEMPRIKGYGRSMQHQALLPFKTNLTKEHGQNNGFTPLGLAVANGHINIVELLITKGADVNLKSFGASPLAIAMYYGCPDIGIFLINNGAGTEPSQLIAGETINLLYLSLDRGYLEVADIIIEKEKRDLNSDVNTRNNIPILHYYSGLGRIREVEFLCKKGADIQKFDKNGMNPILYAAWKGKRDIMEVILAFGGNINSTNRSTKKNFLYEHAGSTPLVLSIKNNDSDMINFLISQGADCSIPDKKGVNPLMYAASSGLNDIIQLLINKNADIHAKDQKGWQPIMYAVNAGFQPTIDLLIDNGADIHSTDNNGEGVIINALRNAPIYKDTGDRFDLVDYLISKGADVNAKDKFGSTVLLYYIRLGAFNTVSSLINKGADIDLENKSGQTPLMISLEPWNPKIFKLLLQKGANVNKEDKNGKAPLEYAANIRNTEPTILLLNEGANVNIKNAREESLLITSIRRKRFDLAALYIQNDIDINLKDERGNTALILATVAGNIDLVKTLVEKGADINAETKYYTAHSIAKINQHEDVAKYLEENGANTTVWKKLSLEFKIIQEMGFIPKNRKTTDISPNELIMIKQLLEQQGITNLASWNPDKKFSSPEKTWEIYKDALKQGQLETAMSCLEANFAKIQREQFIALDSEKMKEISKQFQKIERISEDGNKAKYRIQKEEIRKGKPLKITYHIYFVNIFGEWKIEHF